MQLWIRLTNDGYTSNRAVLHRILNRLSAGKSAPSTYFLEKLHRTINAKSWNQSPFYYTKLLQAYQHQIACQTHTAAQLRQTARTLYALWQELSSMLSANPKGSSTTQQLSVIEVHAANIKCWIALIRAIKRTLRDNDGFCDFLRDGHVDATRRPPLEQVQLGELLEHSIASTKAAFVEMTIVEKGQNLVNNDEENNASGGMLDRIAVDVHTALMQAVQLDVAATSALTRNNKTVNFEAQRSLVRDRLAARQRAFRSAVGSVLCELASVGETHLALDFLSMARQDGSKILREKQDLMPKKETIRATDDVQLLRRSMNLSRTQSSEEKRRLVVRKLLLTGSGASIASEQDRPITMAHNYTTRQNVLRQRYTARSGFTNSNSSDVGQTSRASELDWLQTTLSDLVRCTRLRGFSDKVGSTSVDGWVAKALDMLPPPPPLIPQSMQVNAYSSKSQEPTTVATSQHSFDSIEQLLHVVKTIEDFCLEHFGDAIIDARFYCAAVDAISSNARQLNDNLHREMCANEDVGQKGISSITQQTVKWNEAYAAAQHVVDGQSELIRHSPHVHHALISLLCSFREPAALSEAIRLVHGMHAKDAIILPVTICALLDTATHCLSNMELSDALSDVEALISGTNQSSYSREDHLLLLRSRLLANARLLRGYDALKLLRKYRAIGGNADVQMYHWTLTALYLATPQLDADWHIAKHPKAVADFVLRDMNRDGLQANSVTIALLLRLFVKSAQIGHVQKSSPRNAVNAMQSMIRDAVAGHLMGHGKVVPTDEMLQELIKVHCVTNNEAAALEVINAIAAEYHVVTSATMFEPIIYRYAVVKNAPTLAEDVLMLMTNSGIQPSSAIVDSFVLSFMRQGDLSDALEKAQDMFNQYGVRPTVTGLLTLLDASLTTKDSFESLRVVDAIRRMFTYQQRAQSLGPEAVPKSDDYSNANSQANQPTPLQTNIIDRPRSLIRGVLSEEELHKRFAAFGVNPAL